MIDGQQRTHPDWVELEPPRKSRKRFSWTPYLFIAPNLLGFAAFTLLPLIFALVVSFADWDVISGMKGITWVGLENFRDGFSDPAFWKAMRITAIYVLGSIPLTVVLGLLLAVGLNGPSPGRGILRLIFFIPYIVNAVAISATWILLYHPRYGPINAILRWIGVDRPPLWLASSDWALPALIIMAIWGGVGYNAIIFLAALQTLPEDLYEASDLDGAGVIEKFRSITVPLLSPTTFFLLITGFIGSSQSWGMINLMTRGGPGTSTTVASYFIYQNAFQYYRFGYAAALSWIMFAIVLVLMLLLWVYQRRAVFYDS
ncbi:MAG: sugar ABC transporter permease [Thermomicrobiales bacterium]|nr:sugar ABC transporter permease [Thermomicrobiales bacterium]